MIGFLYFRIGHDFLDRLRLTLTLRLKFKEKIKNNLLLFVLIKNILAGFLC